MENLIQSVRFAVRRLVKDRAFTTTVLLTLAICVGANATIFGLVDAILLRPLPYDNPNRLVVLFNSYPGAGAERALNAGADFFFRRDGIQAFEEVASLQPFGGAVGEAGSTEWRWGLRVTSTFLPLLGSTPALGRNFVWEEMEPGNHRKAILSYEFWQEAYGGLASVLGQDLRLNGSSFTIVGVLPEGFSLLGEPTPRDFLIPIPFSPQERSLEGLHSSGFQQWARLAPGATLRQAQAQVDALNDRLTDEWPVPGGREILENAGFNTQILFLRDDVLGDIAPALLLLWGGVTFVLLIGCANVANLMLARSNVRRGELATRLALGAGRGRVGRQLILEAALLGAVGGVLGLLLGYGGLQVAMGLGAESLPRGASISLSGAVSIFALLLGLCAALLSGSFPLLGLKEADLSAAVRSLTRTGSLSRGTALFRNGLVVGQVAVALVLLTGAGLLLRSFHQVLQVDPGFEPRGVMAGNLSLPAARYPDDLTKARLAEDLLREVRAIPGVLEASVTSMLPFSGHRSGSVIFPEDHPPRQGESVRSPYDNAVSPRYHEAMGIQLLEGRTFDSRDDEDGERVIIIDERLADHFFPEESALGKRMVYGAVPGTEEDLSPFLFRVVGVVASHRQATLTEDQHAGAFYLPFSQSPRSFLSLVVKTDGDPRSLIESVRQAVFRIDPELPLYQVRSLDEIIGESLLDRRATMILLVIAAAVALLLATLGIYGALAYAVSQRTREMGIRMAVGSSPSETFRLVVGQGMRVAGAGLAVGIMASLGLTRLVQSLLFGISPTDPLVMFGAVTVLAIAAALACVRPAWRATCIDPVVALAGN